MSVLSRFDSGRLLDKAAGAVGSAVGLVSLSLFAAALITFPAWPTIGAGLTGAATPAVSVNRTLKGDRLPVNISPALAPSLSVPLSSTPAAPTRARARIPLGCEAAFSPISAPRLAHVFRRCMV
jgi:hypothetical protein